ncbi:MAG: hypothetical protein Q4E24_12045 [bacterium]|nr:hypothetical protein [bacterium]
MFKERYKKAYEKISPDAEYRKKIQERAERTRRRYRWYSWVEPLMKPAAALCLAVCLLGVAVLPVMAKTLPAVYEVVERYAPALSDFILPMEVKCSSNGIIMQVEAVSVEDKNAEIVVSFSDETGYDWIHGKIDLYDSYTLKSFGAENIVSGCQFLEYREEEDKAYFKIDMMAADSFRRDKLQFQVSKLLTRCSQEERQIDLSGVVQNPKTKSVELRGVGGMREQTAFASAFDGTSENGARRKCLVMDLGEPDAALMQELTVMGLGYTDGFLRLQVCGGIVSEADRHLQAFLTDSEGNERHEDLSVGWQEDVDGEWLSFTEHWFVVEEEELQNCSLSGIFYNKDGCMEGNWNVTFRVE